MRRERDRRGEQVPTPVLLRSDNGLVFIDLKSQGWERCGGIGSAILRISSDRPLKADGPEERSLGRYSPVTSSKISRTNFLCIHGAADLPIHAQLILSADYLSALNLSRPALAALRRSEKTAQATTFTG